VRVNLLSSKCKYCGFVGTNDAMAEHAGECPGMNEITVNKKEIAQLKNKIQKIMIDYLNNLDISEEVLANSIRVNLRTVRAWHEKSRTIRKYQWEKFKLALGLENVELDDLMVKFEKVLKDNFDKNYKEYEILFKHFYKISKFSKISYIQKEEVKSLVFKELWDKYDKYVDIDYEKSTYVYNLTKWIFCLILAKSRCNRKGLYSKDYSLDFLIPDSEGNRVPFWELVDDGADLEKDIEDKLTVEYLLEIIETRLGSRDAMVIKHRCNGFTLQELGDLLGVSRERVRQLEERSFKRIMEFPEVKEIKKLEQGAVK